MILLINSEPSYNLDCVKMKIDKQDGVDEKDFGWITHGCNDTNRLYPICEYPYHPANYSVEQNQGS